MFGLKAILIWLIITIILIELSNTITSLLTPPSTYELLKLRYEYPNVIFIK